MKTYLNLNGNSGIKAYEIHDDYIDIEFESGGIYRYSNISVGETNLAIMKALAIAGAGLNAFINKVVKFRYAKRTPYPHTPTTPTETVKVNLGRDEAVPVLIELLKRFDVNISLN